MRTTGLTRQIDNLLIIDLPVPLTSESFSNPLCGQHSRLGVAATGENIPLYAENKRVFRRAALRRMRCKQRLVSELSA